MSEPRSRRSGRDPIPTDPRARMVTDPMARAVADTRDRFLREIASQVPADRIAELHLFRPLRHADSETGVAVIAAVPGDAPPVEESPDGGLPERHTVFTARYRLAIKGAERGKWEFGVVADADAPLVTVDSVVRGVQRRAGDDAEPERLTAESLRAALGGPPCPETT